MTEPVLSVRLVGHILTTGMDRMYSLGDTLRVRIRGETRNF